MWSDPGTTPSRSGSARARRAADAAPASASAPSTGDGRANHANTSRKRAFRVGRFGLATVLIVLAASRAAAGTPPEAGVLVPGVSLGGVHLGWTLEQVEATWGRKSGRCRSCATETRYFNRVDLRPEGAAVTLRRGRVVAVFTLWAPRSWHTSRSLYVGEPERRVRATHAVARRVRCAGYDGLVLRAGGTARTVVYLVDGDVWGFGLALAGEPVCL